MRATFASTLLVASAALLLASPVLGDEPRAPQAGERPPGSETREPTTEQKIEEGEAATDVAAAPPIYQPPRRGRPRGRVGGGVRGTATAWPSVYTLVPMHTGLTVSAQPSLFWFVDGAVPQGALLYFTLFDDSTIEPLAEAQLEHPEHPGIQAVDLAALGVGLEPGREYEWTIALVVDPASRSSDIVAAGWIDRIEAPAGLVGGDPRAYAQHSLWYDALGVLSAALSADPGNQALRASRDALLRQAGLGMAVSSPDG